MIILRRIPLLPFIIVMAIMFVSLLTLYSVSGGHFAPWCTNQVWKMLLGVTVLLVVMQIKPELWRKYAVALYVISLLAVIVVEIMGKVSMGAQRWLQMGNITMQPSEAMRIALVLILAKYFSILTGDDIRITRNLIIPIIITIVPTIFVLVQPDLGTAMLLILVLTSILFAVGVQYWKFLTAFAGMVGVAPILWNCLYEYQRQRILMFLSPEMDPSGAGYHTIQAKIALGSGGFWGKGFLNGTQSQLDFLPEKHTDFIFVAFGEEWGFLGCVVVLCLYALLLIYNYKVALNSRNKFNRILVFGLNAMIFFYIFINISMVCGLLPVVGIPLPFFSYGGNALLVLMACQGIIFAVETDKQK